MLRIGGNAQELLAEVVSLDGDRVVCLPLGPLSGVGIGNPVINTGRPLQITVGDSLRGRVLDGLGRPMDGGPPLTDGQRVSVELAPPSALERDLIRSPMQLGVRALDTTVPVGQGQRLGIFAGSGVGKSSLLSMIARGTTAEINVVA
jgi:flagellum-specific ATP synthase